MQHIFECTAALIVVVNCLQFVGGQDTESFRAPEKLVDSDKEESFQRWLKARGGFIEGKSNPHDFNIWKGLTNTNFQQYESVEMVYQLIEEQIKQTVSLPVDAPISRRSERPETSTIVIYHPSKGRGTMRIVDTMIKCRSNKESAWIHFNLVARITDEREVRLLHSSVVILANPPEATSEVQEEKKPDTTLRKNP